MAGSLAALLLLPVAAVRAQTPPVPIPPGGVTSLPAYQGAPATPAPIRDVPATPQNAFMAPNGASELHNDGWQTDTYTWSGPLGRSPRTFSTYINRICGSIAFDSRGRLVSNCISAPGPQLYMFDPDTLETLATFSLPGRDFTAVPSNPNIFQDFTGGGYFYVDNRDRVVTATTTRHIYVIAETPDGTGFTLERDYDLNPVLQSGERINSALPDSSGRLWFVARSDGVVGTIDPVSGVIHVVRLGHGADGEIENSFATDEHGGVYVATNRKLYRFDAGPDGAPKITWETSYPNSLEHKPGQVDDGTGTTPTIMPGGYVAIADNADPMNVVVYRTAAHPTRRVRGRARVVVRRVRVHGRLRKRRIRVPGAVKRVPVPRELCRFPVFQRGASATENSLIGAGHSLIVENNYGYENPTSVTAGSLTVAGFARVDIDADGNGCHLIWTNTIERAPTVVPKLSLAGGLVYTYTKDAGDGDPWFWTAIDFHSGRTVWKQLSGTGFYLPNNNYAGIAINPSGTAYVGVLGGIEAIRDGTP